jgi:hypothetical protein
MNNRVYIASTGRNTMEGGDQGGSDAWGRPDV